MSVDKIILRAFLSTLAAIGILFVFMITALVAAFPQTMMEITYKMGMESSSIWFAEESYKRTDDVYYIAYATEVAIGESDYKEINSCGEKFIKHEKFDKYCAEKNANLPEGATVTYEQYIYGQVCVAKYKRKDAAGAVERAFVLNGDTFPKNNAVVAVLITALGAGDTATVENIKGQMEQLQNKVSDEEKAYLQEILALING